MIPQFSICKGKFRPATVATVARAWNGGRRSEGGYEEGSIVNTMYKFCKHLNVQVL